MPPLVSILIPAYNSEAWIDETLRSAIGQSWSNKEIIVVDDGSTDGTRTIANGFVSQGVTIVTQPNQGAAAARNHAFALARGDYIQWLDADDLLSPDKIARQMAVVANGDGKRTLYSSGWGTFMHRPASAVFSPSPLWNSLAPVEWMVRKWNSNDHMQTATWLVSRELTEAVGPWDKRLLVDDDGEYFSRIILASTGIKFVPHAKVFYRITGPNRLSYIGRSSKKIEAQFFGMKLQIGYLRSVADDARVRAACVNYLQTWLIHFHPERPDIVEEARQVASSLGGQLTLPKLPWKYVWIKILFGWSAAKSAQLTYNIQKTTLKMAWDRAISRIERLKA